jgi:hypothetical protein
MSCHARKNDPQRMKPGQFDDTCGTAEQAAEKAEKQFLSG